MIMERFTVEQTNLICIYNTCTREGLLDELSEMQTHLEEDETELLKLAQSVMDKVTVMNDGEFDSMTAEMTADFN